MTTPLTSPAIDPTSRAVTTMTIQWKSAAICWVASVLAQTEDRATSAPTDRSMPPPMITKVIPTLTTPMTEASRRIVSTLSTSANRSPAVTTPTMHSTTSAITRPRLRPSGPASSPPPPPRVDRGAEAPAVAPAGVVVVVSLTLHLRARLRSPSAPRSSLAAMLRQPSSRCVPFSGGAVRRAVHHEVEHPVLVEFAGRRTGHDGAVGHHEHLVGQAQHLRDLAGDHHHGHAAVGQRPDQRVDLRAGADVDAPGRFVQQQYPAVAQQPAGQHDLLLVAAGQRAHLTVDVDRPQVQRLGLVPGRLLLRPAGQETAAGEAPQGGQRDVAVDRLAEQQPLALAFLRRQAHPGSDGRAHVPVAQRAAAYPDRAGSGLPGTVDGLQDLRPAGADQAGEAQDLARAHGERDLLEAAG